MDVFSTVLTSLTIALNVLDAYQAFPGDKKELLASFRYDLWAVNKLSDYFRGPEPGGGNEEEFASTVEFLRDFTIVVEESIRKLQQTGLGGVKNRLLYVRRRSDLKDMSEKLFKWTLRLHLFPQLRAITTVPADVSAPSMVRCNDRLRQFTEWAQSAQEAHGREMKAKNVEELALKVEQELGKDPVDGAMVPIAHGERQLILSSRGVSKSFLPNTKSFEKLDSQMGILSAALNCINPTTGIRLLKVESYFYHAEQFIFTHIPPYPIRSMRTLDTIIRRRPGLQSNVGLGQRFSLAAKLAEAVFFLHAAGFVHKNITSGSVVLLERSDQVNSDATGIDGSLDEGFLMGFDLIRGKDARTAKESLSRRQDQEDEKRIWDFDIFQHPQRLSRESTVRYIKAFDVYSLGVLLLQIGAWEPLERLAWDLDDTDTSTWQKELLKVVRGLAPITGERYQRVVSWCLALDGDEDIGETDFATGVLDHLDELASAVL